MDPIYASGTSVSLYYSVRASSAVNQRRDVSNNNSSANSNNASNANGNAIEASSAAASEAADSLTQLISQATKGLEEHSDQITSQAHRIQNLFSSSQTSNGWLQNSSSSQIGSSLSPELETYLRMIQLFSKDDEQLEKFLERMDSYLNGGTGQGQTQGQSYREFMSAIQEQLGASSTAVQSQIQTQQTFSLQRIEQVVVRSGDDSRIIESRQANEQTQQVDPLIFDLDGDGIEVSSVRDGVQFDITGDGVAEQTAFVTGGDAFLALDRNANGAIDDGTELFGDHHGAENGIEELRKFDNNRDGFIDANDAVFRQLRLFVDKNGDGKSQEDELLTLEEQNITKISLASRQENQRIAGNYLAASAYYQRNDGSRNAVGELYLNYRV